MQTADANGKVHKQILEWILPGSFRFLETVAVLLCPCGYFCGQYKSRHGSELKRQGKKHIVLGASTS